MSRYHPDRPRISLTGTISPSAISLSSPSRPPILLHLTLELTNSDEPITLWTHGSFIDSLQSDNSSYCLKNVATGKKLYKSRTDVLRAGTFVIDPDTDLLTVYPGKPTQVTVEIGAGTGTQSEKGATPQICATLLSDLQAGESYKLSMDYAPDDYPNQVWWFASGDKENIVQERVSWWNRWLGRRTFTGDLMSGYEDMVRVEMIEEPELLINR
ncbi:MAG: hypothetical protein M4579_002045 [Chaenotheca gracillima]|nr:MAG: hypothetical protein M4579_002045 [Chaenotheca gracillima]